MTAKHDRKFFDTFMLVLGVLIGVTGLLYLIARLVQAETQTQQILQDPALKAAVAERIAPVGKVAIAGQDNSALEAPQQPQQAAAAPAKDLDGEAVYNMACVACHGAGVAGAPKFGDAAAWGPRIAQGMATLQKHAIEGFQGQSGFMPPKGGRADLTDQSVINAVEYMVQGSK